MNKPAIMSLLVGRSRPLLLLEGFGIYLLPIANLSSLGHIY